ncbi:hypothetical protein E2562_002630, partial [Oryza meyeriana var. granulata]
KLRNVGEKRGDIKKPRPFWLQLQLLLWPPHSSPKFSAGPPRVGQRTSSLLRLKDLSKPLNNKVSQDTNRGIFHMPIYSKENALHCDVCIRSETVLNRIFVCSRCKAAVHIDCYRNLENSTGPWKCELCEDISPEDACVVEQSDCNGTKLSLVQCDLCHGTSGAFRKTADGQWIHAFCAEWLLETKYVRGQDSPVNGMESLVKDTDTCCVCLRTVGACLKCDSGDCQTTFHPYCARHAGFYMNTKGSGGMLQHKAYCSKHSIEQKEAEMQQYGPEEFNSMKRMRVELEKLRLLCERIIKREKVKRERVLCDHDILAKTKDTLVFSYLAHGASSESATTSVNNKSYSGTMQRSDDVTVDSTISGKKPIRFSLNKKDAEINTADSSRTLISFKRKLSERGSLAGKQLPQRPVTSQKLEAGEKKTKDKKRGSCNGGEVVVAVGEEAEEEGTASSVLLVGAAMLQGEEKKAGKVKKGWLAVRVGVEGDGDDDVGFRRFVIPIAYLYHPLFRRLLEAARDAYGYDAAGPLRLPCSVDEFLRLRSLVERETHAAGGSGSSSSPHRVHAGGGHHHHYSFSPCTRAKVSS